MPGTIIKTGKSEAGHTYRLRYHHGNGGAMGLYVGRGKNAISVGDVASADNFEYAMDVADEEVESLYADARAEFAYAQKAAWHPEARVR